MWITWYPQGLLVKSFKLPLLWIRTLRNPATLRSRYAPESFNTTNRSDLVISNENNGIMLIFVYVDNSKGMF